MTVEISETDHSFDYWLSKSFVSAELKDTLSKADILIVPEENIRESSGPCFPSHTSELYKYFKEELPSDLSIDICISDEDYEEYAFYHADITICSFVVTAIALPFVSNILASYIAQKVFGKEKDNIVEFKIFVENRSGDVQKIEYKGSASGINPLSNVIDSLSEASGKKND
jgi:hypothetical protein